MSVRSIHISEICKELNLSFQGNDIEIDGLNLCNRKSIHSKVLSYVTNIDLLEIAQNNEYVCALVIPYELFNENIKKTVILSSDAEDTFYDIHHYLITNSDFYEKKEFEKICGDNTIIEPSAIIESGVMIGNNVYIGHNSVIKKGSVIGDNVHIGCNSVIGSEGFQAIHTSRGIRLIQHVGNCTLDNNVHIGDNVCVCNSLFEDTTRIGEGAKIDNLVYVGHNVVIGKNTVVTAGCVLCGGSELEDNVFVGVNSSINNKVIVGSTSFVGMGSVVTRNVSNGDLVYGNPAYSKGER